MNHNSNIKCLKNSNINNMSYNTSSNIFTIVLILKLAKIWTDVSLEIYFAGYNHILLQK